MTYATKHIQSAIAHLESLERKSKLYDAAPDLLNALNNLLDYNLEGAHATETWRNAIAQAEQAIRKAEERAR